MIDTFSFFRKVPGGALLIPMILSAVINTLFPGLWSSLGGTSAATFKAGTLCICGLTMFALGAATNIKTIGKCLQRNGVLILAKILLTFAFGYAFMFLFGMEGIMGISAVAFMACIASCNPGMYIGLIQDYGDQIDMSNVPLVSVVSGIPLIPMIVLASAGGIEFNVLNLATVMLPYCFGLLMGNLDPALAKIYTPAANLLLPFLGFNFGASINLVTFVKSGISGVVLALVFIILNTIVLVPVDRLVNKRPGYAASSMCCIAGMAMSVPALLGEQYSAYVPAAVPQLGLAMLVSCLVNPFITKAIVNKWGCAKTAQSDNE